MSAAQLLSQAAQVLESRWRYRPFVLRGHGGRRYRCKFELPGVLLIYDYDTGQLLCKSKPGSLADVDPAAGDRHG